MNKKDCEIKLNYNMFVFLVGTLIWLLTFMLGRCLKTVVENCSSNKQLIFESVIKNFMPGADPYGFTFLVVVICVPLEYLMQRILFYYSDLICANSGSLVIHYVSLVLKIILLFTPIIVIGVLILNLIKHYLMNTFIYLRMIV